MTKTNPFKYYKSSPEIIKIAIMYYVRGIVRLTRSFLKLAVIY